MNMHDTKLSKSEEKNLKNPVLRIRIRDPVPFWPLDPGSGIGLFRIPDPILIFLELSDNFLGKKFYNSLKFGPNFFLQQFKNKIILHFVKFVVTKNMWKKNFFTPLFCSCFWIRDPGSRIGKNQDPGSGINIPDPQHWKNHCMMIEGTWTRCHSTSHWAVWPAARGCSRQACSFSSTV